VPLEDAEAEALVQRLWPEWADSRERSRELQAWALGQQPKPTLPDSATAEYRSLQEKAITPWLGLVVQSLAQALIVEGYRSSGAAEDEALWAVWQANQMDAKQTGIYEAAMTTGVAYVAVLPTEMPDARAKPTVRGVPMPEWRPYSSAEMSAFYERAYDEWPAYALAATPMPTWRSKVAGQFPGWHVTLFDDEAVYLFDMPTGQTPVLRDRREHGMGVCPVVNYVNRQTITGRAIGEIEPYTAVASRIDQDVFDRLVVQRFGSWKVRYATGLITPTSDDEQHKQEMALRLSDILVSDSTDTVFGTLDETPLDGHMQVPIYDVRMLAAVSQTPPTHLTGDLANISAEALAAIEAAYNRKVEQRKVTFGEAHEKAFRLSATIMPGNLEVSEDAQVRWRDMESRSMAQTADAFGKLAQTLQIPVEVLWDKLGFLTDQDRERARQLRQQGDAVDAIVNELRRGQTSPPGIGPGGEPPAV